MNRLAILVVTILTMTPATSWPQIAAAVDDQRSQWNWGELIYGRTYRGVLALENRCATEQVVLIDAKGAPGLSIDRFVKLPPRQRVQVPYRISPVSIDGRPMNDEVRGEMIVWHPSGATAECPDHRLVRRIVGRVRMPEFRDAAREAAAADAAALESVCRVWWIRGVHPGPSLAKAPMGDALRRALATSSEAECSPVVRLDSRLLLQSLEPEVRRRPEAWRWLPDEAAIARSSMSELIAFRRRIADQVRAK